MQEAIENETQLMGMLADMAGEIILKVDADGFIEQATAGLDAVGMEMSDMLIKPHLADLASCEYAQSLREYHRLVLDSAAPLDQITFPVSKIDQTQMWYSLSLRKPPSGEGMLGVMRSVEEERAMEQKLVATVLTDQLTSLPNRQAFSLVLSDAIITNQKGAVVLIEIDHFRAITLRFGQSMGDEVVKAFAQFLSTVRSSGATVARMEAERFAVFLPDAELVHALAWTQDMVMTFAAISADLAFETSKLTASAGVARLSTSVDNALSRAELGVSVAKASGGMRTECGDWLHGCEAQEETRSLVASG